MPAAFASILTSKQLTIVNTLYIRGIIATKISLIYTNYQIKLIAYDSKEYWNWVRLREIILRLPLFKRFSIQDLKQDSDEIILVVYKDHKIIGGAQLIVQSGKAKMRQVAIHYTYQNKGCGKMLMDAIESWCREHQISSLYCHARETAASFYLKNGYSIEGAPFTEVGIPHYFMLKNLE